MLTSRTKHLHVFQQGLLDQHAAEQKCPSRSSGVCYADCVPQSCTPGSSSENGGFKGERLKNRMNKGEFYPKV